MFGSLFCCHQLEILNHFFKRGALHFHFPLGPANYVAIPEGGIDFFSFKQNPVFLQNGVKKGLRDSFSQTISLFPKDWLLQASSSRR